MDRSDVAIASFVFYASLSLFLFGCGVKYRIEQSGRKLSEACRYDGPSHANCLGQREEVTPICGDKWILNCECPCHGCVDCREGS